MKNKKNLRKVSGGAFNFGGGFTSGGSVGMEDNSTVENKKSITEDHTTKNITGIADIDITLY